jgi:hypothetical protein
VSGGCCECEHEVGDCTCPGVQYSKSAGIEAECAMRRAWWGRVMTPMVSEMNRAIMWLVADVRGPFQSVQSGGGSSMS